MNTSPQIVTLLTDFGGRDGYIAAMKGVITSLAPDAHIVDAAHDVPAHDFQAAAWTLSQYWSLFPPGSIHVAVVDPGVGSTRKALCIEADDRIIIAPDNGIASLVVSLATRHAAYAIRPEIHRPGAISATFHGRDVFAHVAGLLASGKNKIADLADPTPEIMNPGWSRALAGTTRIEGEVIHVDHFGNLITNIQRSLMGDPDWAIAVVRVGTRLVTRVRNTYSDVNPAEPLALFSSANTLEIAVNGRNASTSLGCGRGTKITIEKGILSSGTVAA